MTSSVTSEETIGEIAELARDFAQGRIAPRVDEWNAAHHVPVDVIREIAEIGLTGILVPEAYGGAGLGYEALAAVTEELARVDAGLSAGYAACASLVCAPLVNFGTEEQKARFLPDVVSGRAIGAYALTEPDAGSDTANLRTAARETDAGWEISGSKVWITNGGIANVFVIFARTDGPGAKGVSAFVAGPGAGLTAGREIPKMGLHTSSTVELSFEAFQVPGGALLGERGAGLGVALSTLDGGRIVVAAQACGIAQAALDLAVAYAKERTAFGGPIARFQGVQFPIADVSAKLRAARLLTRHAAQLRDAGEPVSAVGAQAKLFASAVAVEAADCAVQTLGGYGYSAEFPAERLYRDAKITEIYEGTSQIQRLVIARDLLGPAARG